MPRNFLLRSSALLILLLSAWWFVLQKPLMTVLYAGSQIVFAIIPDARLSWGPSGDWSFRIPVHDSPARVLRQKGADRIDSLDFNARHADLVTFTLGLPLYWAVALALPGSRRIGTLGWGSLLQIAIGVLSVVLFAEVTAYNVLAQMRPDGTASGRWLRELTVHLITAVIPYAAPFISAVCIHTELRCGIFGHSAASHDEIRDTVPVRLT